MDGLGALLELAGTITAVIAVIALQVIIMDFFRK